MDKAFVYSNGSLKHLLKSSIGTSNKVKDTIELYKKFVKFVLLKSIPIFWCLTGHFRHIMPCHLHSPSPSQGFLITNDLSKKRLILYDIATDQLLRQNWAGTTNGICVAAKDRQPWAGGQRIDSVF